MTRGDMVVRGAPEAILATLRDYADDWIADQYGPADLTDELALADHIARREAFALGYLVGIIEEDDRCLAHVMLAVADLAS